MLEGFPPISTPRAHTLILGSMPGAASLRLRQYYAHPRNSFWKIMVDLLDITAIKVEHSPNQGRRLAFGSYEDRIAAVESAGLAIWDVLQACERPGSLDSDIETGTMVPNDFESFFSAHPRIDRIFFNGAKAESVYGKSVLPVLPDAMRDFPSQRLPSTSPAHASMNYEQKLAAWAALDSTDQSGRE